MNFLKASLAWIVIGFFLGLGIWLAAVKGVVWLLALVVLAFVIAVGKIGCATH